MFMNCQSSGDDMELQYCCVCVSWSAVKLLERGGNTISF